MSTKSVMPKPARRSRPAHASAPDVAARGRSTGALTVALASTLLLWASFPPLDLWLLGWLAPVPWLLLVRTETRPRRFYGSCYLAGFVYWLASTQWMRLGHLTMYVAWVALPVYLGLYVVAFVWLCRRAVHGLRVPLLLAAPVVWTGLELLRAHLLSGFPWYFLGHTQYRWAALIQMSDVVGAYGISFLMMLVAASAAEAVPAGWCARWGLALSTRSGGSRRRWLWRLGAVAGLLAAALGYGSVRLGQAEFIPGPKVAMIQGNVPMEIKHDPEAANRILKTHVRLTELAAKRQPELIIWPESMLRFPLFHVSPEVTDAQLREFFPKEGYPALVRKESVELPRWLAALSGDVDSALLIGALAIDVSPRGTQSYNSAAYVTPDRGVAGRYDKVHLVPFGEFLPLARTLPWLIALTPFPSGYGFEPGAGPVALECEGYRFGVLVCYEDTVPHLVRRFSRGTRGSSTAGRQSDPEDVDFLVNITNDGWFRDSSELEQHLIISAFRAVECRTPLVRAANTGISAIIDGNGRILPETIARDPQSGRTREVQAVVAARVPLDKRRSLYVAWGDWFAGFCLWASAAAALSALWGAIQRRRAQSAALET